MDAEVLMYSVPSELQRSISKLCQGLGVGCKKIAKRRYLQPIGCHAGLVGFDRTAEWYEGNDLPDPVLVFSGFTDRKLDEFLYEYRRGEYEEIHYRAIVTKYNVNWNILDLYRELVSERESMETVR